MKVKKISSARKQIQPTPEVAETMRRLLEAREEDLSKLIVYMLKEWSLGKSDLHNWAPVLDRFDDILKQLAEEYMPAGPQSQSYSAEHKQLIMCILGLEKLLLENSSSRNLFNTYDRLNELLLTNDMDILECTLELLVLPARKLEAHRHLLKTYNEQIRLVRLKLLAGVLLPEELDDELVKLSEVHKSQAGSRKLLHIRLVSLYILLMLDFHTHDASESVIFSVNPLLIEEIAKLITCAPVAPMKVEAAAMFVMRACLKFDFKAQEISNCLNLSAGHGTVMNLVRTMGATFCSPQASPYSLYFITGFTDLLYRLCSSPDYDAELLNAGIMEELVKTIENCHPQHYRHVEKYVYSIDSMISKLLGTMDAFMTVDGLNAIVRTVGTYSVVPCPAGPYLAALFRLLEKIMMCHGSDERLRNLVETPLFSAHVKFIYENAAAMGPEVLTKAACVMATFIHNEPNTLSILQECGVEEAFIKSISSEAGIPSNAEFIAKVFTALSALCLNTAGTNAVKEANPFARIFAIFLDRQYSRALLSQTNSAAFGQAVDEFMRHHPLLKDMVLDEMMQMLDRLPGAMATAAQDERRFNHFSAVDSSAEVAPGVEGEKWEMEEAPAALLFEAACMMLETIIANPLHFVELERRGCVSKIVRCMVNGSLPYDFVSSASSHSLAHLFQVVSEMEGNKLLEALSVSVNFEVDLPTTFISDIYNGTNLDAASVALNQLTSVSNVLDFLCEIYISSAHGHLRTVGSMADFVKNTDEAQIFFNKLVKLAVQCRLAWMDLEKLPITCLKTVLNFEGKDTERPIDLLLAPKYEASIGTVDLKDPRIVNLRMAASVMRELIDSVIAVFASFAKASCSRRMAEHMQEPKVLLLMRNLQVCLLEEALKQQDAATFSNFASLGMFLLDNMLFEDVTSKVHLMSISLLAFTESYESVSSGLDVFHNAVKRAVGCEKNDLGLATFTSIAVSFMDYKSYGLQFSEEFHSSSLKRLQGVFEVLGECCYTIVKTPQLVASMIEESMMNVCMLLALTVCPEVDCNPGELQKYDAVEYFNFRKAALLDEAVTSEFVDKSKVKFSAIFKQDPRALLNFVLQVFSREQALKCLKYVAACVSTFFQLAVEGNVFVGVSKARMFRLLAAVTVLSSDACKVMWGVISRDYQDEREEESVICILLVLSQIVGFVPEGELNGLFLHVKSLMNLSVSADYVQAMLQCLLAFSVHTDLLRGADYEDVLRYLIKAYPVAVQSTLFAHEAIVNLIPLIIRANVERFSQYSSILALEELKEKAKLVKTEFVSFNEFMNDRLQPLCNLYSKEFIESVKGLFKTSLSRLGSFDTADGLRDHLKSNLKLCVQSDGLGAMELDTSLIERTLNALIDGLLSMTSGEGFSRCGLVSLLSELCVSYPRVHAVLVAHPKLPSLLDYMFRSMTAAVEQDMVLQQHNIPVNDHSQKMKMENVIERAWCQYFIHCLLTAKGNPPVAALCKLLAAGLTSALKACQGEEPERAVKWLFGLVDMIYHLLTMRIGDDSARKLIISKMVAHLVENKVIVLISMVLRAGKSAPPKVKEMTEGKVVRTVELLTRYGNRLRKVGTQSGGSGEMMLHGDEDEDDYGYESFDEEEDNPVEEEAEMLAEAENEEDAMHSEDMMDVDEIHSMTTDDSGSHMMDEDDDMDDDEDDSDEDDDEDDEEDTDFESEDDDDDLIMDEEEDFMDDGTLEIAYDDGGEAHYQLRPEDIDFHASGSRRASMQRFVNRMMDNAASLTPAAGARDNEEEDDYVTVADENSNLPSLHPFSEGDGEDDDAGEGEEDEGEEMDEDEEYEFELEARMPPLTRATGGFVNRSRRFPGENALQLLDRTGVNSFFEPYSMVAFNGPSHITLPLHSFFEEKPNTKVTALNTLCTPVCTMTMKRWAQLSNLFKNSVSDYDSIKSELLEFFIQQGLANFKPPTKKQEHVQQSSVTEEGTETETDTDGEYETESEVDVVGESVYEDPGVDISFLEALPFDMRQEVLEQHFEERRHLIPNGATVRISQSFLNALPEDLRADYIRLSEEDVSRGNLLRRGGFGRGPLLNNLDLQQLLSTLDPVLRQAFDASLPSSLPRAVPQAAVPVAQVQAASSEQAPATVVEESPAMADVHSIVTLLSCFYEPLVLKDKRTMYKMMLHLCSNQKTRIELMNLLLLVLEETPKDVSGLESIFDGYLQSKAKSSATPRKVTSPLPSLPPRPATAIGTTEPIGESSRSAASMSLKQIVIVQRTLQLLMYLVGHEKAVVSFFITESEHPLIRQASLQQLSGGKKAASSKRMIPLVLLLTCFESPEICSQSMLVEYMLHLIALVTARFKVEKSPVALPLNQLHTLVRTLQVCEFTYKASIYANQSFSNFAALPNVCSTLVADLKEQSDHLLDAVAKDLQELCRIRGEDALEMEKIKDLCASTSSQNRLLRVYKILNSISNNDDADGIVEVSEAFRNFTVALSAFLETAEERMHITTGLMPLIESFFLHYKLGKNVNETFAERHRKALNALIRTTPTLLLGSMSRLALDCPHVLEFDNKRIYFKSQLHKRTPEREQHSQTLNLNVRRSHVFEDSFQQVMSKSGEDFRYGRLNVKFYGEDGVDAGGVTREWFSVLTLQMFNADYALFRTSAVDKITYAPNRMSSVNPDHLQFFRFVGRVIAKAINDGRLLDAYFTRSFYKCILGRKVELTDLEAVDPDYYKSLLWMLNNDITDVMELTFSMEVDDFGVKSTVDLVPDGRNLAVTEGNKREYVQRVAEHRLVDQIKRQIDAFLTGFRQVIPLDLIKIFDEQELELLISGLPEIDVDDWKNNTEYQGYTLASAPIQWFWRCVRAMSLEERAKVIQFVTGTSKVPLEGFAHLQGSSGRQRFQIHRDFGAKERLPSAHTCFNQLDLPEYDSYEALRDMLKKVIGEFGTGFGLA